MILSTYLSANISPLNYLRELNETGHQYNGFNLLLGDLKGLYYCSNRKSEISRIAPGFYGLSNRLLNTPWPKTVRGIQRMKAVIKNSDEIDAEALFRVLADQTRPPLDTLPDTGVGLEWEKILSPIFITSPGYGTRSSSIVLISKSGKISFRERTFDIANGQVVESGTRTYEMKVA